MKGECNCKAIAFELTGKLPGMYQCHCTLCQKQGGNYSNASTIVALENFKWLHGEERITKWKKDSGFNSHFCKTCGSPVPNLLGEAHVWIPMGLIGDAQTEIVTNIFIGSKPNWSSVCDTQHQYYEAPDSFEELVNSLVRDNNG